LIAKWANFGSPRRLVKLGASGSPGEVRIEVPSRWQIGSARAAHSKTSSLTRLSWPWDGGGGSDNYYSNAMVRTDLDPAALGVYYATQLRDAGWTARGEGHEGPVAWSAWTFRDEDGEEWRGLLFALRRPEVADEYVVYLRADVSAGDAASGGWSPTTF